MDPHFDRYHSIPRIRRLGESNFNSQQPIANSLPTLFPLQIEDVDSPLQQREVQSALLKAEMDAKQQIAEIESRAAAQLKAAEQEIEKWRAYALSVETESRQQGYDDGFATGKVAGYEAGLYEAHLSTQPLLDRLNSMIQNTVQSMRQTIASSEEQIAQLTIELAQIMIGEAIAVDPDLLARRILRLLDGINSAISAQIRMHPDDIVVLQPIWQESARSMPFAQDIRFISDPSVQTGGCIIETKTNFIDAQISTLVERITESFEEQENREPLAFQVGAA